MKEAIKNGAAGAAPYANTLGFEALLMALDERFKFGLTRTELALLAPAGALALHFLWKYGRPIAKALYKKLLVATGAALILISSAAYASEARLVADCAEEVEMLNGETNQIEKTCKRERVYFDLGLRFGGVAFKLNRPREILAGFDAGAGWGLRVRPDWWDFTPSFFSLDLFANAGYVAREGTDDAVAVGGLLVLSLFDWFGVGIGINHAFGLGSSKDETTFIGSAGLAKSL